MAYIIWSKELGTSCIVSITNDINDVKEYKEQSFEDFSLNDNDDSTYYYFDEIIDAKSKIYVFIFIESGGGGSYHDMQYVRLSNSYDDILEIATDFFINESADIEQTDINQMLVELKTNRSYDIPCGRSYECTMILDTYDE